MSLPTADTPGFGLYRGKVACDCLIAWLPVFERGLQRLRIIDGPLGIYQLTGGYSKSGGTHRAGAYDVDWLPVAGIRIARDMGADATWARPHGWDGANGIAHTHGVLTGCPHLSAEALQQIEAVRRNDNGLVGTAADTGPRPLSGRTWRQGLEWARLQEDDMFDDDAKKKLNQVANGVDTLLARTDGLRTTLNGLGTALEELEVLVGDDASAEQLAAARGQLRKIRQDLAALAEA